MTDKYVLRLYNNVVTSRFSSSVGVSGVQANMQILLLNIINLLHVLNQSKHLG